MIFTFGTIYILDILGLLYLYQNLSMYSQILKFSKVTTKENDAPCPFDEDASISKTIQD